jgi:hypothetical protein
MVHGQAFHIATRQPSILSANGDVQGRSVWSPRNCHQNPPSIC